MVSICTITYNHEKYIAQAIESFLMQKTNFSYEIIICDDNSTDNTFDICNNFNSDKIKLYRNENNIGSIPNLTKALNLCSGKYIAWCEGDDFWTDPLKLQKQVDFLEANPDYSLCFHNAIIMWDDKSQPPKYFCSKDQKQISTIEDVIEKWFIPSASMVFRSEYINPLPLWFKDIYNGDWALQILLAHKGPIKYIDEIMSVYRKNQGALSGGIGKDVEFVNNQKIKLLNYFNKYSDHKYNNIISTKIDSLQRSTHAYKLRKKNKVLYWLINPIKLLKKF